MDTDQERQGACRCRRAWRSNHNMRVASEGSTISCHKTGGKRAASEALLVSSTAMAAASSLDAEHIDITVWAPMSRYWLLPSVIAWKAKGSSTLLPQSPGCRNSFELLV